MKKLIFFSTFLIGTLTSLGQVQSKKKDIDKDANVLMDSLSKVYNKKVFYLIKITQNDTIKTYIAFAKENQLTYELISAKRVK